MDRGKKQNFIFKNVTNMTLKELNRERCPRISADDVVPLIRNGRDDVVIVDIRNPVQ